jgi:hypothetical protein
MKIISCDSAFRSNCDNFYSTKVKKGKETKVPAKKKKVPEMYNMVKQLSPTHGPWHEVVQLLHNCDEAFNDSAAALRLVGMPAYHTACL